MGSDGGSFLWAHGCHYVFTPGTLQRQPVLPQTHTGGGQLASLANLTAANKVHLRRGKGAEMLSKSKVYELYLRIII